MSTVFYREYMTTAANPIQTWTIVGLYLALVIAAVIYGSVAFLHGDMRARHYAAMGAAAIFGSFIPSSLLQ